MAGIMSLKEESRKSRPILWKSLICQSKCSNRKHQRSMPFTPRCYTALKWPWWARQPYHAVSQYLSAPKSCYTNLLNPEVNDISGGISFLLPGSTYGLKSKTANTVAMVSQTVKSAKKRPGHILTIFMNADLYWTRWTYLLPNPDTRSLGSIYTRSSHSESVSIFFPFFKFSRCLSGRNWRGSWNVSSSFIIALKSSSETLVSATRGKLILTMCCLILLILSEVSGHRISLFLLLHEEHLRSKL